MATKTGKLAVQNRPGDVKLPRPSDRPEDKGEGGDHQARAGAGSRASVHSHLIKGKR
ncbi:MAG: hypothetical protein ACR2JY_14550 [Chloroflexota bacterium]